MPHGESWFSFFPFHQRLLHLAEHYEISGIQHIYAALFVLCIIAILGVATDTAIRNSNDILPDDKLTIRNFMELIVGAVFGMVRDIMGDKAARHFLPLLGTCFIFILFSNAIGLVPGFLPATDTINTTFGMALVIFFTTHIYGIKENGWNHVKHLFGPVLVLAPLIFVIEIISHIVRPCSLAVRLMANMMADHMVLTIFAGLLPVVVWWIPIPLPMYLLGCLVVVVQALVFTLLSTVYIGMAIEHAEH